MKGHDMTKNGVSRRSVLVGSLVFSTTFSLSASGAKNLNTIKVHRDPNCGCCGAWVDHLRASGFLAEVIETAAINRVKSKLGVPQSLASCHTAEVDKYVIEGHVPAPAIKRLLSERPLAKGLAVPGMPVGSPGMEIAGSDPETYEVVLFGAFGQRSFGRFRGATEVL
jgi:hypothetical protein